MKFGLVFFLICGIIVISIFGWTIGLLILIPAGLLCLVIFSIIGGAGDFIDDRIDHHYDRIKNREHNLHNKMDFQEDDNNDDVVEYVDYINCNDKKT